MENLFLVEEILRKVNSLMGFENADNVDNVKKHIIDDRFKKQVERQICQSVVAELKYELATANISNNSEVDAKKILKSVLDENSYEVLEKNMKRCFKMHLVQKTTEIY